MPYRIGRDGDAWTVENEDTGKVMGHHDTEDDAKAQLRALYANVTKYSEDEPRDEHGRWLGPGDSPAQGLHESAIKFGRTGASASDNDIIRAQQMSSDWARANGWKIDPNKGIIIPPNNPGAMGTLDWVNNGSTAQRMDWENAQGDPSKLEGTAALATAKYLQFAPEWKGVSYRGMNPGNNPDEGDAAKLDPAYWKAQQGQSFTWYAPASATLSLPKAEMYAESDRSAEGGIIFKMNGGGGRAITGMSPYPEEREVYIPPNTAWTVGEVKGNVVTLNPRQVTTTVVKYSEDEARDEHGRWSASGGDAIGSTVTAQRFGDVGRTAAQGDLERLDTAAIHWADTHDMEASTVESWTMPAAASSIRDAFERAGGDPSKFGRGSLPAQFTSALQDMPEWNGVTYRGLSVPGGSEVGTEAYWTGKVGQSMTWYAPASTTLDQGVAASFAKDDFGTARVGVASPVVFRMEGGDGKYVGPNSVAPFLHEVIQPPGSGWTVAGASKDNGILYVNLTPNRTGIVKYSEDEARDEHGRWSGPGDSSGAVAGWSGAGSASYGTSGKTATTADLKTLDKATTEWAQNHSEADLARVKDWTYSDTSGDVRTDWEQAKGDPSKLLPQLDSKGITDALSTLPEWHGQADRYMGFVPGDAMADPAYWQAHVGQTMTWYAPASATLHDTGNSIATYFKTGVQQANAMDPSLPRSTYARFELNGGNTRYIGPLSDFPKQHEVVTEPNSRWTVTNVTPPTGDGPMVIHMDAATVPVVKYSPDQERDDHGRFAGPGSGGGATVPPGYKDIGKGSPTGDGSLANPKDYGSDIQGAALGVLRGEHIRLDQPVEAATLTDQLAADAKAAVASGQPMPKINLENVSIEGTNLFAQGNKGIPRLAMPQTSGITLPGSLADAMKVHPGDPNEEVDLTNQFIASLKSQGISVTPDRVSPETLRATQNELDAVKVDGISHAMDSGKMPQAPIFVTRDNYVLDGHHRWAASVVSDARDGKLGNTTMPVNRINMDIGAALDYGNAFMKHWGIAPAGVGTGPTVGFPSPPLDPHAPSIAKASKPIPNPDEEEALLLAEGEDLTSAETARSYLTREVTIETKDVNESLRRAASDGYAIGSLATVQQIPGADAGPAIDIFGPDYATYWDNWSPGNYDASKLLDNGGFQALLAQQGITVQGLSDTTISQMGTILANGAANGDSPDQIASDMMDVIDNPDRAYTIANTELNRAMSAASLDTYQANGIDQWDWSANPGACDDCSTMEDGNPHDASDEPPPMHPNCRCAAMPVLMDISEEDVALSAFDAPPSPVLKYSEDEARDDHGRWSTGDVPDMYAAGGMDNPAEPGSPEYLAQQAIMNGDRGLYPGASADLAAAAAERTGLPPDAHMKTGDPTAAEQAMADKISAEVDANLPANFHVPESLPTSQEEALARYLTPDTNQQINDGLRAAKEGLGHNSDITSLDAAIKKGKFTENDTLYRGVAWPNDKPLKVGDTFSDKAYTSATISPTAAKSFAQFRSTGESPSIPVVESPIPNTKPLVFKMNVDAGQHALPGDGSVGEFILPRGTAFTVTHVTPKVVTVSVKSP